MKKTIDTSTLGPVKIDPRQPLLLDAEQVRAAAADLVRRHAERLGMDEFGAGALIRAIKALPVQITFHAQVLK